MKWIIGILTGLAGVGMSQVVFQPVAITAVTGYRQSSQITAPARTAITVTVGSDTFVNFTVPAGQNFSGTLILQGSSQ